MIVWCHLVPFGGLLKPREKLSKDLFKTKSLLQLFAFQYTYITHPKYIASEIEPVRITLLRLSQSSASLLPDETSRYHNTTPTRHYLLSNNFTAFSLNIIVTFG